MCYPLWSLKILWAVDLSPLVLGFRGLHFWVLCFQNTLGYGSELVTSKGLWRTVLRLQGPVEANFEPTFLE